ncbi:MAG: alpha/beta fold hydrolase, partial [Caulobacterales bacterium]
GKPILVGHSMGGMAIGDGAEKAPECAGKLVYLTALMLPPGETLASAGIDLNIPVVVSDDGLTTTVTPEVGVRVFYNDCDAADIAFAMPRLKPQAASIFGAAMQTTPGRWGRIPRAYIECTNDNAVAIEVQRTMIWRAPVERVVSLDSGHSPFFSMPGKLADALHGLA